MGINVACSADIAVPQPLLNFLQAHYIGIKQAGAAMAQVVETDTLHLVCYQKIREMLAQEIGPNPLSLCTRSGHALGSGLAIPARILPW